MTEIYVGPYLDLKVKYIYKKRKVLVENCTHGDLYSIRSQIGGENLSYLFCSVCGEQHETKEISELKKPKLYDIAGDFDEGTFKFLDFFRGAEDSRHTMILVGPDYSSCDCHADTRYPILSEQIDREKTIFEDRFAMSIELLEKSPIVISMTVGYGVLVRAEESNWERW